MKLRSGWTKGAIAVDRQLRAPASTAPTSISGATSPAPRAMARIMPVMMPGTARGRTMRRIVCHLLAPQA